MASDPRSGDDPPCKRHQHCTRCAGHADLCMRGDGTVILVPRTADPLDAMADEAQRLGMYRDVKPCSQSGQTDGGSDPSETPTIRENTPKKADKHMETSDGRGTAEDPSEARPCARCGVGASVEVGWVDRDLTWFCSEACAMRGPRSNGAPLDDEAEDMRLVELAATYEAKESAQSVYDIAVRAWMLGWTYRERRGESAPTHDCYDDECGSKLRATTNARDHYKGLYEQACRGVAEILERTGMYPDLPPDLWTLHTAVCKLRQECDDALIDASTLRVRFLALDPDRDTHEVVADLRRLQRELSKPDDAVLTQAGSDSSSTGKGEP